MRTSKADLMGPFPASPGNLHLQVEWRAMAGAQKVRTRRDRHIFEALIAKHVRPSLHK